MLAKPRRVFAEHELDRLAGGRIVIALDQISDPQNLGAVLRSAAFFGADAVLLLKNRSAELTPKVARIAVGGAEFVDVYRVINLARSLDTLRGHGYWVYGLDERGEGTLRETEFDPPDRAGRRRRGAGPAPAHPHQVRRAGADPGRARGSGEPERRGGDGDRAGRDRRWPAGGGGSRIAASCPPACGRPASAPHSACGRPADPDNSSLPRSTAGRDGLRGWGTPAVVTPREGGAVVTSYPGADAWSVIHRVGSAAGEAARRSGAGASSRPGG